MPSTSIRDLIGCKFTVHGRTKEEGFDCYGLAIEVLRRNGIELPDVFYSDLSQSLQIERQLMASIQVTKIDNYEKNCIILITNNGEPTHIGIYIGEGMMIHSVRNIGVVLEPVKRWKPRIKGLYKVSNN